MSVTLDQPELATSTDVAVQLSGVAKVFGHGRDAVTALENVDLTVAPGEFVCLLGASGCGKSTMLNLVADLDAPTTGTVTRNTTRPAVMFQDPALMPWLTAGRNVELALRLAGFPRTGRKEKASELLQLVRLEGQERKRPHELSGGMRQRVALARSLASTHRTDGEDRPSLLLMDEPFAALDAMTKDVMQGELLRIHAALQSSVLFVTHDVREAVRLGRRIVLLSSRPGRVVREWTNTTDGHNPELVDEINAKLREVISTHARKSA
ncbi:sulfate ABC transporter ATP-binding protein [Saccharomonospora sp. CUA-673]|uniref:ABC transporter ATP-binding protein n=1 Tax=Saccharomonospora sp. CUA-673 TaxID=1904969 RepID=UPI000969156E|nr:ABC transporter ATP-binding protein [Saccharomonospora sp. CUA-673]OLT42146.1 sulfate ABC transporter ATP-binding protein [Saccharomonospora sp. CUA-673]